MHGSRDRIKLTELKDYAQPHITDSILTRAQPYFEVGSAKITELRKFLNAFGTTLAVCAAPFASKPIPVSIQCPAQELHECKSIEDVRRLIPKEQLPDEKLATVKFPTYIERGSPTITTIALDEKKIEATIHHIATAHPMLFSDAVVRIFADEKSRNAVEAYDSATIQTVILDAHMKKRSKRTLELQYQLMQLHSIPFAVLAYFVLPRVIALQAKHYLDKNSPAFIAQYPQLKKYCCSAQPIFRVYDESMVKFFDENFPSYVANRIAVSSNLSSMIGPTTATEVEALFDNTVFNEKHRISTFIVSADKFKENATSHSPEFDIVNYFLYPKDTVLQCGKYEVIVRSTEGEMTTLQHELDEAKHTDENSLSAKIMLQIRDTTKESAPLLLTIYFFKTKINGSLNLTNKMDLERFLEIYKLSLRTHIAVHSSQTDMGRVGQIIFILELAKYFETRSNQITLETIGEHIQAVLYKVRSNDPALVSTEAQYLEGIRFAWGIYAHLRTLANSLESLSHTNRLFKMRSRTADARIVLPATGIVLKENHF